MLNELGWPLIQIAGASMPHASMARNVELSFERGRFQKLVKHACAAAVPTRGTQNAIAFCAMRHTRWVSSCVAMHGTARRRSTIAQHCNKAPPRRERTAALASQVLHYTFSRMRRTLRLQMAHCPLNMLDSSAARGKANAHASAASCAHAALFANA